jgi:hypothetical protein
MLTHVYRRFFSCTLLIGNTAITYGKPLTLETFVTFVSFVVRILTHMREQQHITDRC